MESEASTIEEAVARTLVINQRVHEIQSLLRSLEIAANELGDETRVLWRENAFLCRRFGVTAVVERA